MATTTDFLGLKKPAQEDYYNVDDWNDNSDTLDQYAAGLSGEGGVIPALQAAVAAMDPSVFAKQTDLVSLETRTLGRGARIPTNGDCDSLATNGKWYAENASHAGGLINTPFSASGFVITQEAWYQVMGSTSGLQQTAEAIQSNTYYQRKRFYLYANNTWAWTAWKTVITQSLT